VSIVVSAPVRSRLAELAAALAAQAGRAVSYDEVIEHLLGGAPPQCG